MFRNYKEIWFGGLFGLGAVVIDTVMHAQMLQRSFLDELTSLSGGMVYYRLLFLSFGFTVGWLMWRNNRREREVRALQDAFDRFRNGLTPLVVMSYSRLQLVLTRPESSGLPRDYSDILQNLHEDLRTLKKAIEGSDKEARRNSD